MLALQVPWAVEAAHIEKVFDEVREVCLFLLLCCSGIENTHHLNCLTQSYILQASRFVPPDSTGPIFEQLFVVGCSAKSVSKLLLTPSLKFMVSAQIQHKLSIQFFTSQPILYSD